MRLIAPIDEVVYLVLAVEADVWDVDDIESWWRRYTLAGNK
jgi:hypothetical protein